MSTATESAHVPVNLPEDLVKMAQMVAAAHGLSLPEYLANRLRPLVENEVREVGQR